ncbi:MAG: GAP1-N2 domain-containing protein [Pirellulaceae bacterium]
MFVEQAIFTSMRSGRNEGYQIAAMSPGVSLADQRELAQWGPGHDSLYDPRPTAESVNFHHMESGLYCLSRTVCAGREYSGRGGFKVYSQCFLLPPELLRRFANHPFRVIEALLASGRAPVLSPVPDQLDPVPVLGRAAAIKIANVERLCQTIGPERLVSLLCAALKTTALGVSATVPPQRLLGGLLELIPPPLRTRFPLTTGLKVSPRRLYRLAIIPYDREQQRQAIRLAHLTTLDLHRDAPATFAAQSGWPLLMYELLRNRQFAALATVIESTADTLETDTDLLAEQARASVANHVESLDVITPFLS